MPSFLRGRVSSAKTTGPRSTTQRKRGRGGGSGVQDRGHLLLPQPPPYFGNQQRLHDGLQGPPRVPVGGVWRGGVRGVRGGAREGGQLLLQLQAVGPRRVRLRDQRRRGRGPEGAHGGRHELRGGLDPFPVVRTDGGRVWGTVLQVNDYEVRLGLWGGGRGTHVLSSGGEGGGAVEVGGEGGTVGRQRAGGGVGGWRG